MKTFYITAFVASWEGELLQTLVATALHRLIELRLMLVEYTPCHPHARRCGRQTSQADSGSVAFIALTCTQCHETCEKGR